MNGSNGRIWIGIILIALGALYLLENFGFFWFDFHPILFGWHTMFLLIGVLILINHKNSLAGYVFIILGLIGTLRHTVPFFFNFGFADLWPIILLLLGLRLILKQKEHSHPINTEFSIPNSHEHTGSNSSDYIDEVSIFNNTRRIILSENFSGGKVTTIMGGTKLDFSSAKLAPGEHVLEVVTIFGGANLRVPSSWNVVLNVTSVFGGFEDKRFGGKPERQPNDGILIIKGISLFGGGELVY